MARKEAKEAIRGAGDKKESLTARARASSAVADTQHERRHVRAVVVEGPRLWPARAARARGGPRRGLASTGAPPLIDRRTPFEQPTRAAAQPREHDATAAKAAAAAGALFPEEGRPF